MTQPEALDILYQALSQKVGLLLDVTDFERARALFYKARRDAKDPELSKLQFRSSSIPGGNLAICKGQVLEPEKKKEYRTLEAKQRAEDLGL